MAVLMNSDTDYLTRGTNLPSSTNFTIAAWVKLNTALSVRNNDYQTGLAHYGTTTKSQFWGTPSWETPGSAFQVRNDCGGGGSTDWATTKPTTATWYYIALTGDATNNKGYFYTWNGSTFTRADSAIASIVVGSPGTASALYVGSDGGAANSYLDASFCYVRVWDVALTPTEIEAELVSSVIVKTANINTALGACTSSSFANDVSGNGRNWTLGAGLTTSDFDSDVPSGLTGGGASNTLMGQACL